MAGLTRSMARAMARKMTRPLTQPAGAGSLPASQYGLVSVSKDGSIGQIATGPAWASPQWYRESLAMPKTRTIIPGATSTTYTFQFADLGYRCVMAGLDNGVLKVAAPWQPVLPVPVLIDAFDVNTGYAPTGSPVLTVDAGDKVQGAASLLVAMQGVGTRLIKTIGSLTGLGFANLDDLGVVAWLQENTRPYAQANMGGSIRFDQTGGTPSNSGSLSPSGNVSFSHKGKRWNAVLPKELAYLQGKDPALSWRYSFDSSAASAQPFAQVTRYDAMVGKAQGRAVIIFTADDAITSTRDIAAADSAANNFQMTFYLPVQKVAEASSPSILNWNRVREAVSLYNIDPQLDGTRNDTSMVTTYATPELTVAALVADRATLIAEVPSADPHHICYPNGITDIFLQNGVNDFYLYKSTATCAPGALDTVITNITTTGMSTGNVVDGFNVPANCRIVTVDGPTQITVDKVIPGTTTSIIVYDDSSLFFPDKLQDAMRLDGTIKSARTTAFNTLPHRFGPGMMDMFLPGSSISNGSTGSFTDVELADNAIARMDVAIARGEVIVFYLHGIQVGGTFITTPLLTWQLVLAAAVSRRNAGYCDIMSIAQWWAAYGGASFPN